MSQPANGASDVEEPPVQPEDVVCLLLSRSEHAECKPQETGDGQSPAVDPICRLIFEVEEFLGK